MTAEPSTIGRYQIRRRLGAGGFATVYRAYDPLLDIDRAIKVLHPHLAGDAAIRERFIREGRALARIRHPNLVQVHDAGESGGAVYLAMELIEGVSLEAVLKEHGPLSVAEVAGIVEQTARALAAVHAHNLVHRDVKPDNILVEAGSSRVVLLDLGVARDLATATAGTWIVGTPSFMSPEQVRRDGEVTVRTDVYQLGATAYMALCGQRPFEGDTFQVLDAVRAEAPPDLQSLRPDLPPAVIAAVAQAMAKDPALRPATAPEFAALLRSAAGIAPEAAAAAASTVLAHLPAPPSHPGPPLGPPPGVGGTAAPTSPSGGGAAAGPASGGGTRAVWLAGGVAVAVLALVAAVLLLRPRGDDGGASGATTATATRDALLFGGGTATATASATAAPSSRETAAPSASPAATAAPTAAPSPRPTQAPPSPVATAVAAGDGQQGSVVVTKAYGAAVRVSPSSDARIAVSVGCGTVLRVLGASAGWYRVALDAPQAIAAGVLDGWVGQLRVADAAGPRPDCSGAVLYRVNDQVLTSVQSGCLSLRDTPSRSATILRCVENGTRYTIVNGPIEVDGEDWFEVTDPRIGRGWSLAQFLLPAR